MVIEAWLQNRFVEFNKLNVVFACFFFAIIYVCMNECMFVNELTNNKNLLHLKNLFYFSEINK